MSCMKVSAPTVGHESRALQGLFSPILGSRAVPSSQVSIAWSGRGVRDAERSSGLTAFRRGTHLPSPGAIRSCPTGDTEVGPTRGRLLARPPPPLPRVCTPNGYSSLGTLAPTVGGCARPHLCTRLPTLCPSEGHGHCSRTSLRTSTPTGVRTPMQNTGGLHGLRSRARCRNTPPCTPSARTL